MKISLDWISDFVDLTGVDDKTLADRLTLSTAEVEGFEVLQRAVASVLVAEVLSVSAVPGDGHLHLATIDCGGRRCQTVCGAPNLRVGMKAPFAPAGTVLSGGTRIEVSTVGSHRSEGVLCSAMELGMSRWHEGVLEIPSDLPAGDPLAKYIPERDVIVEIDNKSLTHRPDLWGHYGFAREFAAILNRPLRELPVADLAQYDRLPAYPLEVEDAEGCPCYSCLEFRVPSAVASPLVIQRRLHALGQRTYNLLVDLTNYVMLELAQPTHAFDGDWVRAIRVKRMGSGGVFTTLDGQNRQMLPDDLLIWNQDRPVAIAGVMGGQESEVRPTTTRVLLESANFKASRIRRTSVRLDLRTESAQRFEKSQPPYSVKLATARILNLVQESGARPEVTSRFTVQGDLKDRFRPLEMSRKSLWTMAGKELPDDEVLSILHRLGFQASFSGDGCLKLGIPPHRSEKDLSIPADIVEEVLRVYGYGRIEPRMPMIELGTLHVEKSLRTEHKARRLLAASHRFVEVQNYGWFDDDWLARIHFELAKTLQLKNPSAQANGRMRTTMMPNMLALVRPNRVHRDEFRLFELGRVYEATADGGSCETARLAGLSYHGVDQPSLEEHFRQIRGVLEDLARMTGCGPWTFVQQGQGVAPWQAPGHWVEVRHGDRLVGSLGVLTGPILETVAQEGQVVWFELAMEALDGPIYPELKYIAPPIYPGSWQDFSLVWDIGRGFAALEEKLDTFKHPLVMRREFLYVYKGKGLPSGKGSFSFRYWIGSWDHTLSAEEIEGFRTALLKFLETEGIPLR